MMGIIALILASAAAAWALWRAGRGDVTGGENRSVFVLKLVVWLGLAAALFAAKLAPLALMVLIAAGGVTAIEIWRDRQIKAGDTMSGQPTLPPREKLRHDEAAAVLGVAVDAGGDEIKAAHRKLIAQLHPDKGGTDYLAAKINEARKVMLEQITPAPSAD